MGDDVVQRVLEEGGRDCSFLPPPSSILQSVSLHVTFHHGCYLLIKAIQELRGNKEGLVMVGIGGPSGSGKTSLADKVASVLGCIVNDLESIDFNTLV